jgi:hypothetical protein
MSYHTSERVALALLVVLAVLTVGLTSTSTGEEAQVPVVASSTPALLPSELTTGSAIGVEALEDAAGFETSTNKKS